MPKHTPLKELIVGAWLRATWAARTGSRRCSSAFATSVGKVGMGYSEADRIKLRRWLEPLYRCESPFTGRQPAANAILAAPVLVAEIEFAGWTASGMLRHPSTKACARPTAPAK